MEKEFIKENRHSVTLNVTAGTIDSFRETEKTTGTVRVYDKGCIGVAGCLGKPDEAALTEQAKQALAFDIPYPCKLDGPLERSLLQEDEILPIPTLIPTMQRFLDRLGALCPNFIFSNKISLSYLRREYRNSAGRRLLGSNRALNFYLAIQSRGSGNMMDNVLLSSTHSFDEEALLSHVKNLHDAFLRPVELVPGRYPVVFAYGEWLVQFIQHLTGPMYASGASLFSGKLGQKLGSERLTLAADLDQSTNPATVFFDVEGCVSPDYRPKLIDHGVLTGLFTTKKSAAQYDLPNLGIAGAAYDGAPRIDFQQLGMYLEPTAKSLEALVPGKAIYVMFADGGNATPEGHFATPVQTAYLMEDGKLVGRLPELQLSTHLFDLLGKDYIGTVMDALLKNDCCSAFEMDVTL